MSNKPKTSLESPMTMEPVLGISEIFASIQGEGTHVGTAAVFVRLSGCNLNCRFCDTDFSLRELCDIPTIIRRIEDCDTKGAIIILTGGEPLAQTATLDLIHALSVRKRRIHIESNGTIPVDLPDECWLTVSPKERVHPKMAARADEVKLIVDRRIPVEHLPLFTDAPKPFFLQPEANKAENIRIALEAIHEEPTMYRLSLQTHKFIGVR